MSDQPEATESGAMTPPGNMPAGPLQALVSAATQHVDLYGTLQACLTTLLSTVGGEAAAVYLPRCKENETVLNLYAPQGLTTEELALAADLTPGQGYAGAAMQRETAIISTQAAKLSPPLEPCALEAAFAGSVALPLPLPHSLPGVLWVGLRSANELDKAALEVLTRLAEPLGQIIQQRTRFEEYYELNLGYARWAASMDDCMMSFYLQPEPRVELLSQGFTKLTGYPREKLLADLGFLLSIVHTDDQWIFRQDWERLTTGRSQEIHNRVRLLHATGAIRWAHTRGRAVRDEHGLRVDAIICDVTDHVRLEEQVRRADRLSAVGMLAGGIAHEYNNLHFAIIGTLDLLLMRDDLEETVRQYVNRVREAAERASEITNKLVAFAKGGSGIREVMDVGELADSTLSIVRREFATQGIEIVTELAPQPLLVNGNRAELGQVIISMAINAQQAMEDSPVKHLQVRTGLKDGRIFVSLTDTGHGIAPDNLPRLFDPFFTTKGAAGSWLEDRAATDAYLPGRGLGLSVAQSVIKEHGGDIEVHSEFGEGATFTIWLPPVREAQVVPADSPEAVATRGRILVADDEEIVREVCREMLVKLNFQVAEAAGGEEALALLAQQDFDLILVDLQMPDMDGLELIRRVNEIPLSRRPAKVIITGRTEDPPADVYTGLGVAGTLHKPSSLVELVEQVQKALASREADGN